MPTLGQWVKDYAHRLVWTFGFERAPELARWEVIVDAHSGELLAFQDKNHYVNKRIAGNVYPLTSTEICPTPQTLRNYADRISDAMGKYRISRTK